jgi:4'-phosphopantetheinyl transferase EntD
MSERLLPVPPLLSPILPVGVSVAESALGPMAVGGDPAELHALGRASPRRTCEFVTARSCARLALRRLGVAPEPILRGPRREPLWPDTVVGSITHCRSYCGAAVTRRSSWMSIGVDAEPNEPLPPGLLNAVTTDEERWAARSLYPSAVCWDRLFFSAKESIYKVWFPLTNAWLGFQEVHVSFFPDDQSFVARLSVDVDVPDGEALVAACRGRYRVSAGRIGTAAVVASDGWCREPARQASGRAPAAVCTGGPTPEPMASLTAATTA